MAWSFKSEIKESQRPAPRPLQPHAKGSAAARGPWWPRRPGQDTPVVGAVLPGSAGPRPGPPAHCGGYWTSDHLLLMRKVLFSMTRVSRKSAVLGPEKMQPWEISSRHRSGVEQNFWVVPEGSDSPRQPPAPSDVSFSVGVSIRWRWAGRPAFYSGGPPAEPRVNASPHQLCRGFRSLPCLPPLRSAVRSFGL